MFDFPFRYFIQTFLSLFPFFFSRIFVVLFWPHSFFSRERAEVNLTTLNLWAGISTIQFATSTDFLWLKESVSPACVLIYLSFFSASFVCLYFFLFSAVSFISIPIISFISLYFSLFHLSLFCYTIHVFLSLLCAKGFCLLPFSHFLLPYFFIFSLSHNKVLLWLMNRRSPRHLSKWSFCRMTSCQMTSRTETLY